MYRSEMQRFIERALKEILSMDEAAITKLSPEDQQELAALLTSRIWAAGYELEPRMRLGHSASVGGVVAS